MKTRSLRLLVVVALACPLVACAPVATAGQLVLIANGVRNTVAGARIDAHSGTILRASDGRFYWYGERYGCGFYWNDPTSPYCGVQVYSSRDLVNWDGPWPAFNAGTGYWQDLCMHVASAPGNGCFRPKVVFNPRTRLYVLWLNTPETDDGYRVLTSHAPLGPFQLAARPELQDDGIPDWSGSPNTRDGDEGLFVDPSGGGWVIWNRGGRMLEEALDDTFTTGRGVPQVIMNYPELKPYEGVESPSEFVHDRRYYIAMSLPRCPYCDGTNTAIEQAPGPDGPWSFQGTVSAKSCGGQPNEVDALGGGLLLWTSDQWLQGGVAGLAPRLNETLATQAWEPLGFRGSDVTPISCRPEFRLAL
ncbi:MAG TPA: family 43 glycosylhydrolase [Candidatus Dormibacteraeota bacterium]|nr:family 43 glycosylhydrolase [Candidatus Dormibacteraeota bacterium]